jgi:hypothetical protein
MKKILFILIFAALMAASIIPKSVQAQEEKLTMAGYSGILKSAAIQADSRVLKLEGFLTKYNSPLTAYAQDFITLADQYQIDWKLVPAITGVESTFGNQIPYNSYNAYGWANGNYAFKSWEDSITIVTKALKEKYYNRGLDNPYKIGPVYAPPSQTWASRVNFFMEKIEEFDTRAFPLALTI